MTFYGDQTDQHGRFSLASAMPFPDAAKVLEKRDFDAKVKAFLMKAAGCRLARPIPLSQRERDGQISSSKSGGWR